VEQIAALPEVHAVFPHMLPELGETSEIFDNTDVLESPFFNNPNFLLNGAAGGGVRVALLDTGIDHNHPEFASHLDETGRVPGWQYFYEDGTVHNHGASVASRLIAIAPEIELWSIQKATYDNPGIVNIAALEAAVGLEADVIYTFGTNTHNSIHPHATAAALAKLDGHIVVTGAYVSYTFNWGIVDVDNIKGQVHYNEPPPVPFLRDIPANPGYRFDGWEPAMGPITEDTTFTARWMPIGVVYTFDWGIDGVDNLTGEVSLDTAPSAPSGAYVPANPGYRFDGWNPPVGSIDTNTTFEAIWTPADGSIDPNVIYSYTFDWGVAGIENLEGEASHNDTPPLPSFSDLPANPGYRFDGWNPAVGPITEDTTFEAVWLPIGVTYTFDWGIDGINNPTGEVSDDTAPAMPSGANIPANPGFSFDGWTPSVGPITEDTVFEALWTPIYIEYTFDWRLADTPNLDGEVRYNDETPTTPTEIPSNPGYQFNGWTPVIEPLTENTIFNATWIPLDMDVYDYATYTFDWGLAGVANPIGLTRYGTTPVEPSVIPTNPRYIFNGWTPSIDDIEEDTTFTAIWTPRTIIEIEEYTGGNITITLPPDAEYEIDDDGKINISFPPEIDIEDVKIIIPFGWEYEITDDEILVITPLNNNFNLADDDPSDNEPENDELLDESDDDELLDNDLNDDELDDNELNDEDNLTNDNPTDSDPDDQYLNNTEPPTDNQNDNNDNELNDDEDDDLTAADTATESSEPQRLQRSQRPTLPQTGAIAGVSVLSATALTTSGVAIASIKKQLAEKNSLRNETFNKQFEEEYYEIFDY